MDESSTSDGDVTGILDSQTADAVQRGRLVGMILHQHGNLRLVEDPCSGQLLAEVNGFYTPQSREFLRLLDALPNITSEILVCDAPGEYSLDETPVRERHMRRNVA